MFDGQYKNWINLAEAPSNEQKINTCTCREYNGATIVLLKNPLGIHHDTRAAADGVNASCHMMRVGGSTNGNPIGRALILLQQPACLPHQFRALPSNKERGNVEEENTCQTVARTTMLRRRRAGFHLLSALFYRKKKRLPRSFLDRRYTKPKECAEGHHSTLCWHFLLGLSNKIVLMKFLFVCNNPFVLGNSMLLLTLCRFIGIRSCARGRQWGQRAFRWRSPPFNLIFFFIVLLLILDLLLLRLIARRSIVELVAYIQYTHTQTNMCRVHAGLPISRPAKKKWFFYKSEGLKK